MVRHPSRGTLRLLALAAGQRAGAASWEAIARLVKRRPETCRAWPTRYAEYWDRFFRETEDHLLDVAAAEAVVVLAKLTRSRDEKVRRQAAAALVRLGGRRDRDTGPRRQHGRITPTRRACTAPRRTRDRTGDLLGRDGSCLAPL